MKIFYAVQADIPSKAAHSLHFMKQCQGLAANGHEVYLIFPATAANRKLTDRELYEYYNVEASFKLVKIPYRSLPAKKLIYCLEVARYVSSKGGIFFTRDPDIASVGVFFGLKTMLELHAPLSSSLMRAKHVWKFLRNNLLKSAFLTKIIVISDALKNNLIAGGIKESLITVAHDGSDIPAKVTPIVFADTENYNAEIGYTGHLYEGKGMEIIIKVAAMLPKTRFHVVGGFDKDINYWKEKAAADNINNIVFHGFVKQSHISAYIYAFDICLLPNQRSIKVYGNSEANISDITSPLKMFDYMAHGKAIISSDIAVLKEVLNEENAVLCDPDDAQAWANAMELLMGDNEKRSKLGNNALRDFEEKYTWKKRAELIVNSFSNYSN
ncbi:MAG: glycosyltransferase family 4 protein [Mucilaginibacter sp.]